MRIGIDARAAAEERGGRGTLVRELLGALDTTHEVELFAREPWNPELPFRWTLLDSPDGLWHLRAALAASRSCDVFLSTNSFLTPLALRIPSAVVVCDLVSYESAGVARQRSRLVERATMPLGVRRARALIAISETTARDLAARFRGTADKTSVARLAASERFARPGAPAQREQPYVLAVGTIEPRKNLSRLVAAFSGLPGELRESHELVLVGPVGWEARETLRALERQRFVRHLGPVSDDELAALYRGAAVFAYPSLYEGFGLPVLEAMAAGAPVLTSAVSALPEVAGEAALYADPLDVGSIRDGLRTLLEDGALRERLAAAGRSRAAGFSWKAFADEVVGVLERIAR